MTPAAFVNIGPGARLPLRYASRHVGIFGATGTGKTTSAAALIERFSAAGVPVLVLDAKGDLESLSRTPGGRMWDCTGARGMVRRLNLATMGPDLMSRALDLSPAQSGVVDITHALAAAEGLDIATPSALWAALSVVMQNAAEVSHRFGLVTPSSVAAVQRALLRLERDAGHAFGAPALDPFKSDRRTREGRGAVTVLRCAPFVNSPGLYGATVAHILGTLYRGTTELGDTPAPGLAVFVDESHLVFDGAAAPVVRQMESVVRLIRSKGVALMFATQSPGDLPPAIAGQLATRIQHGLRGATAQGLAAIKGAAETMPTAPGFNAVEAIKGLGTGEALVSVPALDGRPGVAQRIRILPGTIQARALKDSELPRASYFPDLAPPRAFSPTRRRPGIWARLRALSPL